MGDVIKFNKPKPVKPPRQTPPTVKKALVIVGVMAAFILAWAYFQYIGST
ncbi:hypothetical protein MUU53_03120 [Rhizobium lemnae]|uniref:Uncharacterized protein n=1 Tax=Rhizobium lemnae TaxID=1214924 RepID=A0ABV8EA03_9HYPH|nr:hypothetical protein [Rhizobium lemnae]MCJ8506900.1 hypothetical protein [Rhizobium lemnae]